jgi:hypothetical protein
MASRMISSIEEASVGASRAKYTKNPFTGDRVEVSQRAIAVLSRLGADEVPLVPYVFERDGQSTI